MKTSRLKNIVIVILLLVNAFLLFLLLSRRAEERDSNERRVEQLCTLFEKNGVAFDRALLPDEETHLSLSLERDAAREEAFASAPARHCREQRFRRRCEPLHPANTARAPSAPAARSTRFSPDRSTIPRALANSFSKRLATLFSPPSSRMAAAASRACAAKKVSSSLTPR